MPKVKQIQDGEVLETALLTISKLGPKDFTLAAIGEKVGLAPATLLQRFGSKQKLLVKAGKHANTKLVEEMKKLQKKKLHPKKELILLLASMPEGFGSRQDIANSLGLLELDMVDPELHPIAKRYFILLRKRITELLEQMPLSSKRPIETLVWELDALRHGLVIQWTLSGKGTLKNWIATKLERYLNEI